MNICEIFPKPNALLYVPTLGVAAWTVAHNPLPAVSRAQRIMHRAMEMILLFLRISTSQSFCQGGVHCAFVQTIDGLTTVPHETPLSQESVAQITRKFEENLRLRADGQDTLARAKETEELLEQYTQDNAQLKDELDSARLEMARLEEAHAAAEAKAARCEVVSVELKEELQTLGEEVAKLRKGIEAREESLKQSDIRVIEANIRLREIDKVTKHRSFVEITALS